MTKLKVVCYLIGISQLVLGALYLFAAGWFIGWQGLTVPATDINYPLGMLAGRFIVYGVGMFVIAQTPRQSRFWLDGMIAIQAIDLAVGLFYTATGVVTLAESGIAMFDATLFIGLLLWVRPETEPKADAV